MHRETITTAGCWKTDCWKVGQFVTSRGGFGWTRYGGDRAGRTAGGVVVACIASRSVSLRIKEKKRLTANARISSSSPATGLQALSLFTNG